MTSADVWIVYHGAEYGSREDCSIFHTPTEIYDTEVAARQRASQLKQIHQQSGCAEAYVDVQKVAINTPQKPEYL